MGSSYALGMLCYAVRSDRWKLVIDWLGKEEEYTTELSSPWVQGHLYS